MLNSGVLILTLKLPSPKRSPMFPEEGAGLGAGLGAGAGAATEMILGAGARMTGEGAGTRTRPITRRPELEAWRPLPEPTTELTVWETRGWMAETTWLTTSSLALEEEEVVVVVAGLRLLEEDPEMAEPTAELTRGWI